MVEGSTEHKHRTVSPATARQSVGKTSTFRLSVVGRVVQPEMPGEVPSPDVRRERMSFAVVEPSTCFACVSLVLLCRYRVPHALLPPPPLPSRSHVAPAAGSPCDSLTPGHIPRLGGREGFRQPAEGGRPRRLSGRGELLPHRQPRRSRGRFGHGQGDSGGGAGPVPEQAHDAEDRGQLG